MAIRYDNQARVKGAANTRGRLMIFGRPTLMWEGAPTAEEYYKQRGYSEVHTMDVSDYEGATYVHDLNNPVTPAHMKGQYDAISFGGTAEHVFNVGNVLKCAAEILAVGGTVACSAPVNNWIDHGFYQLCPTLKFDFFEANKFDMGTSVVTIYRPEEGRFRRVVPVYPGEAQILNYIPARISHTLMATKTQESTTEAIPLQSIYKTKHMGQTVRWRFKPFAPYDVEDEIMAAPQCVFELKKPTVRDGHWAFLFRDDAFPPSMPKRPFRSRALLYENGRLLDWIVSDPEMVADRPGSYCHSGAYIHFTPTAGASDAEANTYTVGFPQPFDGIRPYEAKERFSRDNVDITHLIEGEAG